MRIELTIYALPKLPNRLLGAHWRTRSGQAAKWKRFVGDAFTQWLCTQAFNSSGSVSFNCLQKARITLLRCSPRQCDFDGLVGSFKSCVDALVHHGIIEDDTPAHIETTYEWLKVPTKEQCVKILVEGI